MSTTTFSQHTVHVNHIDLHYIQYANSHPTILFLHGLTANAHAFDGVVQAGLTNHYSLISVDMRGRGLSSKPAFSYSIQAHVDDIIALLDYLHIQSIIICGHSFGGLLGSYLCYHFPTRFPKLIILDAAPSMNPKAPEMLGPALARIDSHFTNFDTYLHTIQQAPYLTFWDPAMLSYYLADVATAADLSVEPRSNLADIIQIATAVSKEPWSTYFTSLTQPSLLVIALDNYTMNMPLLPEVKAKEIAQQMKHVQLITMSGNHQTMLYGKHALQLVQSIVHFLEA